MDGGSTEDARGGPFTDLGGLERWRNYSQIAIWCIVLCGSVLLNATLLVAFIRRPGLRTISNRFVMNLIASNLLAIFVLTGLLITGGCGTSGVTTSFGALSNGATALVTTSSILSVLLIGIDQYLAVVDPLRYHTRIDKLRCALLILGVWLIALLFAGLASLNPRPQGVWHLCLDNSNGVDDSASATEVRFQASVVLNGNATDRVDLEIEGEISFRESGGVSYNASAIVNNITETLDDFGPARDGQTYGLIYALIYALVGYLVPFFAICWIYVSIYLAARNNSERTRRNGSRPILSTGSVCEETFNGYHNGHHHHHSSDVEDFRRLPKISSLSSIDENSEASPSQIISAARSHSNEHMNYQDEDEDVEAGSRRPSAVIFTVGTTQVDISQGCGDEDAKHDDNAKESTKSKVPIVALKAKFLSEKKETMTTTNTKEDQADHVKSKFPEVAEYRRKSSHDILYEEMMIGLGKHPYEYDADNLENSSDEDDDEEHQEHHDIEEALPLSTTEGFVPSSNEDHLNTCNSTRSISVNFDLGDLEQQPNVLQNKRMSDGEISVSNSSCGILSHPQPPPIVTITPPGQKSGATVPLQKQINNKSHPNSYITNLRHKISNGSLFKYREETRAARISTLVIIMGLICWTPYVYVLLLRNHTNDETPPTLNVTALGFLVLATYVSPLLFGYRSRRVKRELRKFFCFKRELSYKNNRSLMAKKVLRRRHSGGTILGLGADAANGFDHHSRYNIFNCVYGRNRWPKEKVQFVQVPDTALAVETCRSSFSSGASTQISSTSTDEC